MDLTFPWQGRSLTAPQVSWVIIGTLVGGVSTIGTVQSAYNNGISAWIFTLGSGVSCFYPGLFFCSSPETRTGHHRVGTSWQILWP